MKGTEITRDGGVDDLHHHNLPHFYFSSVKKCERRGLWTDYVVVCFS